MGNLASFFEHIQSDETVAIGRIRNIVLKSLQSYAQDAGFFQLMPVLMSPITDPLNHAVYPAEIAYEQHRLKLTASMIFHKQLALNANGLNRIFILAPNIRLEKASVKSSDNHLLEFSQFDLEIKDASMYDVMHFLDGIYKHVLAEVRCQCAADLALLGRELPEWKEPFQIYSSDELRARYGDDFELLASREATAPFFVTNFKREFYDRENPEKPGTYNNFDLVYPDGYGEALSGAEREFEHDQIVYRMNQLDMDPAPYRNYLEAARLGRIPRTAGAGIGVERLIKFICGKRRIKDVCLFDRSVGTEFLF